ncbi:hypothetical protein BU17DRAFT_84065 [Hysterangium stoloniferum]|nr:hypothetical protein BU17DRAFT_84065 [Hysterangium stoloniferum]
MLQVKKGESAFRPLQIINEERSTHGLRYGDYTRYRTHCAHKTHRLRQSLKMTHGKGRDFKKLAPIAPENANDGHLQLLLFETERAWAHAQELSAPEEARRSTARYRRSHNYLSRLLTLARSPSLAAPLSPQATVELLVYALIHTARFNLRRSLSSTATYYGLQRGADSEVSENEDDTTSAYPLIHLSIAHALLEELESTAGTSKEVALARSFKDEIGPEIRWCVHEFNRGGNEEDEEDVELKQFVLKWKKREWDIDGIVGDIAPAYAENVIADYNALINGLKGKAPGDGHTIGKRHVLEELLWDNKPVPVRNPELVDVLLKVQEATGRLKSDASSEGTSINAKGGKGKNTRGRIAKYDGILLSLSDAVDEARKLVEAQQVSGSSSITSPGSENRDIHFMQSYLTFLHLTYRVERDLILLFALSDHASASGRHSSPQNTASILHLLSGVLQSLFQALALPIVDESPDLSTALSLRISHVKAQRALYLAQAYAHNSHKRYGEAVTLTQRGHLHIREARSTLAMLPEAFSSHLEFYPMQAETLDVLEARLKADEEQYKIEWFAYNGGVVGEQEPGSKHQKPVFFDIAFNYVQPPMERLRVRAGLPAIVVDEAGATKVNAKVLKAKAEEELEKEEEKEEEKPMMGRGGLSGFLGSWWGRK